MEILAWILIGLTLLTIASGVYCFAVACVRGKDTDWLDPEAVRKTPYAKYHNIIQMSHQWLLDHNATDVYVTSNDGLKLHGLWVTAPDAKGTVLLAHGYRSTKLIDFGIAFAYYHSLGLNLLIPDQRSHGKSEGKFITFGVKESEDLLCWLDYHNRVLGDYQVILSGMSMGASTVMFLADRSLPGNVKGIIADCGFSSPKAIISKVFKGVTHLPAAPSIWITELCARIAAGFSLYERDTLKILPKNRLPILLIHGGADDFVPCEMTRRGYDACAGNKQLLIVDGAGHGVSFLVDQERYMTMVFDFLKANLEGF